MSVTEQLPSLAGARDTAPPQQASPARVRRRRPGSVLALMLVAGLLLGLATYMVLRDRDVTYRVAVAATDLRAGTVVSADSFRLVDTKVADQLAAGLVHADHVAGVTGWVAANTVAAASSCRAVTCARPRRQASSAP
ncbi:MAG TPA: SAF domain-containing protein [Egibacteraceae bacterium]|nr:SAF domain-containing protein [Egibacteraceae bacterium]